MMASRGGARAAGTWLAVAVCCAVLMRNGYCDWPGWCSELVDHVAKCWIDFPEVPTCKGREVLERCAEKHLSRASSCDEDTRGEIDQMVKGYSSLTSLLCQQTPELRNSFEQKRACWYTARNCIFPTLVMTSETANQSLCREAVNGMLVCGFHNFMCRELQSNLTAIVFRSSACSSYKPEVAEDISHHLGHSGHPGTLFAVHAGHVILLVTMATAVFAL